MVKGSSLESNEMLLGEVNKYHVFKKSMKYMAETEPIAFKCYKFLRPDLRNVVTNLELVIRNENGSCIDENLLNVLDELSEYTVLAKKLSKAIALAVNNLSRLYGIETDIKYLSSCSPIFKKIKKIRASRAIRTKCAATNLDGNDFWTRISERLKSGQIDHCLRIPGNNEIFTDVEAYSRRLRNQYPEKLNFCMKAMETAEILAESAMEISDIEYEIKTWKILPCCMAQHQRLGQASALGLVGLDVMKMIFSFM